MSSKVAIVLLCDGPDCKKEVHRERFKKGWVRFEQWDFCPACVTRALIRLQTDDNTPVARVFRLAVGKGGAK